MRLTSSEWRRVVGVPLAIALIMLAIDLALRQDPHPKGLPFESTRTGTLAMALGARSTRYDYVFLGSSICACNVSPSAFTAAWGPAERPSAFNFGVNGASLLDQEALYRRFLSRHPIGTVVIVLSLVDLAGPLHPRIAGSYALDYFNGGLPAIEDGLMNVQLFRFRRQLRDLRYQYYAIRTRSPRADLDRRLGPSGLGWRPAQGGFARVAPRGREGPVHAVRPGRVDPWRPTPAAEGALRRLLAEVRGRGSHAIVVIPPLPPRFWGDFVSPRSARAESRLLIEAATTDFDVPLVDLQANHPLPDSAFFDRCHMQNAAVAPFSRALGAAIRQLRRDP